MPNARELWLIIKAKNMTIRAFKAVNKGMKGITKVGKTTAKALKTSFRAVGKVISGIGGILKKLAKLAIAPLAGLALGFVGAVREAALFEQAMANVSSVLGAGEKDMERLARAARDMGEATIFNAQQAASAMYDLASAGFNADQVIDSLKGTMMLAAATASDLTAVTETVTATLKQFDLEARDAERVANVFAAAISKSKLNMDRISRALVYAGPVAAGFGHKLEGTVAALAQFANMGLAASQIGTAFRMGLLQLQRAMPIKDIEKGADVLKRLKIQFKEIDPSVKSVADIVEVLHGKVTKMSEAVALFGVRAGGPFLKLIKEGPGPLRKLEKEITNTRKAEEMMAKQLEPLRSQWTLFMSALKELGINIGTTFIPALKDATNVVTEWIKELNKIDFKDWWANFKKGAKEGSKSFEDFAKVFAEGGPVRLAMAQWLLFFSDIILTLGKIVWKPLETGFIIMLDNLVTILKIKLVSMMSVISMQVGSMLQTIGQALNKIPTFMRGGIRAGDIMVGAGKALQVSAAIAPVKNVGAVLEQQKRAQELWGKTSEEINALLQVLLATSPREAITATGEAIKAIVTEVKKLGEPSAELAETAKLQKEELGTFIGQVIDANGQLIIIARNTREKLAQAISRMEAQIAEIKSDMTRGIGAVGEIGG